MAEVTAFRNNATPYPIYGFQWALVFPILNNTGALVTGAAGLDSERSLNGDTFADCTNEATEIATSSGMYYLLLTEAEMTAEIVTVIVKTSTTDAKTTPMTLYPRHVVSITSGTAQGGTTSSVTLATGASAVDGTYVGMLAYVLIDSVPEVRMIASYTGSSRIAIVVPDWNTAAPDNNDTYAIYLPDGFLIQPSNVRQWQDAAVLTPNIAGAPKVDVTLLDGLATNGNNATLNLKQLNIVNSAGSALIASATGSNGHGIAASGNGSGEGVSATGGATGHGAEFIGGATSGDGIKASATNGNSHGIESLGQGSGEGITATGGASGNGIEANGGSSSGSGISAHGGGVGDGILAFGGANSHGLSAVGVGTGAGVSAFGGATGHGVKAVGGVTSGDGILATTSTNGHGIEAIGVGSGNDGLKATGAASGHGIEAVGSGSGDGLKATSGTTGVGLHAVGGATSGAGMKAEAAGTGLDIDAPNSNVVPDRGWRQQP